MSNNQYSSLLDVLQIKTQSIPEKVAFTYLLNGGIEAGKMTYQMLDLRARAIASHLQNLKIKKGERAILFYTAGLDFVEAFWGCIYAGIIAVPVSSHSSRRFLSRLETIIQDSQATVILTSSDTCSTHTEQDFMQSLEQQGEQIIFSDRIDSSEALAWQHPIVDDKSLVFLQYTSGSIGNPKGVMVTHANILHNLSLIHQSFQSASASRGLSWLPHYHDMGLIGGILEPTYIGATMYLMSPVDFIQRPFSWLKAISTYKATITGGPNFAYDLCVRKITPEQKTQLDLSSWEVAFNGAEVVRSQTLDRFVATFSECGFRPEALYPCYGMAEITLMISGGSKEKSPVIVSFEAEGLEQNLVLVADPPTESQNIRTLVSCGQPCPQLAVKIVNPETCTPCLENQVGEIWVHGPSVAQGYWNKPQTTEEIFKASLYNNEHLFLRTGDLGFFHQEELFITGRLKDLIIIRGRNFYPQDIELTVEQCHRGFKVDCGAAFTIDVDGEEKLVIAHEVERQVLRSLAPDEMIQAIRQAVGEQYELPVYAVALLKPGGIPKTSSGKIQRHACRSKYLNNSFDAVYIWQTSTAKQTPEPPLLELAPSPQKKNTYSSEKILEWLINWLENKLNLHSTHLNANDSFFNYEMDSIVAVELILDLEQWLGLCVDVSAIWNYSTPQSLSQYLFTQINSTPCHLVATNPAFDPIAETTLDPTILLEIAQAATTKKPQFIFLTGVTGFLGAFLLEELLQKTSANIYCLVRSANEQAGKERIISNLRGYGIWHEEYHARVIAVVGDLTEPLLGLSSETFHEMAQQIDVIYHSGAQLNFVYSYAKLKRANVLGTQEIIRLACQTKLKPLHHVSTVGVFEAPGCWGQIVTESNPLDNNQGMYLGYAQSKWVAEKLVMSARDRGLPVCIYRPSLISGHSQTGAWSLDDVTCRLLKGCIQMGSVPKLDIALDISSVDYVARSIVYLSMQPENLGRAFHLHNPQPFLWKQLIHYIQFLGYDIQEIPYSQWQKQLQAEARLENNPLLSLLPFFLEQFSAQQLTIPELYQRPTRPLLQCEQTLKALSGSGITCTPWNAQLLDTYFSYFTEINFLARLPLAS